MSYANSTSNRRRYLVLGVAAIVIVLALISAFAWPGWAINRQQSESQTTSTQSAQTTKPTIKASALPDDASELLKAMPDTVDAYARVKSAAAKDWTSSKPIEEYALTYSQGGKNTDKDMALHVAQWSTANEAETQYEALVGELKGTVLAQGSVKVSGANKGSYVVKADDADKNKAIAVWQNGTAVFQVSGDKDAVLTFYHRFPL